MQKRIWLAILIAVMTTSPVLVVAQYPDDNEPRLVSEILAEYVFGNGTELFPCTSAVHTRVYNVVALRIPVSYNNWGDWDPQGRLFVLAENVPALLVQTSAALAKAGLHPVADAVRALGPAIEAGSGGDVEAAAAALEAAIAAMIANPPTDLGRFGPSELAQPLIVRANLGDCVVLTLTNALPEPVSIHAHALQTRPGTGMAVGTNLPDLTLPGETRPYVFYVPPLPGIEGAHFLHSHADSRYQTKHGLFGAIVAEPEGYTWLSPQGQPLRSGWEAMLVSPDGSDFREHITMYHDEIELIDHNLRPLPVVSPFGEYGPGTKGINLRSEPFLSRFNYVDELAEQGVLDREHDKSQAYGSYTNGDPGVNIPRGYVGDPTKFRLLNAGPGQHHVHHLHGGGDRWPQSPVVDSTMFDDGLVKFPPIVSTSERQDVQNVGPGESFNLLPEGGAGGVQQTVGDLLFHCHIVEHYVAGMWSFWRVYNTKQPDLAELPDRASLRKPAVTSLGLIGKTMPDGTVITSANLGAWVEKMLPPPGVPLDDDASVWDWTKTTTPVGPLYKGEPETTHAWPNYASKYPGQRLPIRFNPEDGRLAFPFLSPHLGERPPFAPNHGPAPHLGLTHNSTTAPDGLCPPAAPSRDYNIVALGTKIEFNEQGDVDEDGQIFVHAADRPAVENETKPARSLVLRANQGDCVDILFSSALKDQTFIPGKPAHSKVNMHIHLVQFDVQASDGVVSGFNYEQTIRPATVTGTALAQNFTVVSYSGPLATNPNRNIIVADGTKVRVGTSIGVSLTTSIVEIRRVSSVSGNNVTLDQPLTNNHPVGDRVGPEFVKYRWYPDVELGIVYWHDHVDGLNSWRHGLFASLIVEPAGSQWCDPKRPSSQATVCPDMLDGHVLDIVNANDPDASFREFVAQFFDRGCIGHERNTADDLCTGASVNPQMPRGDREPAGFNMRSEPLHRRNATYPLASWANNASGQPQGLPGTDLWEAYPGDNVRVRLLYAGQSSTTGVGTFAITGHRFQFEQNNPGSRLIDAISFGESSMHNFRFECGAGGCRSLAGDYLYYTTQPGYLDRGAWGVLRVHNSTATGGGLRTLPGNTAPQAGSMPLSTDPNVTLRSGIDLVAMPADVTVNSLFQISQPLKIYARASDKSAIENGTLRPSPLIFRAKPGDLIPVTLTNHLDERVSMHSSLIIADPDSGLGIPVGNNSDSTLGPGETGTFYWFVDRELGATHISSFGHFETATIDAEAFDQAAQGLYGSLVVEPSNVTYSEEFGTSSNLVNGSDVTREHVLLHSSHDPQFMSSTMTYLVDVRGVPLVNYRSEPLHSRVGGQLPDILGSGSMIGGMGIHSCQIEPNQCLHDLGVPTIEVRNPANPIAMLGVPPETPNLDATRGQALVIRNVGGGGDQLRMPSLEGHWWAADPDMPNCRSDLALCQSNLIGTTTLGTREASNAWIPAAGPGGSGTYVWSDHRDAFLEAGAWGTLRVCEADDPTTDPFGHVVCAVSGVSNPLFDLVRNTIGGIFFGALNDVLEAGGDPTETQNAIRQAAFDARNTVTCDISEDPETTVIVPPGAAVAQDPFYPGFEPRCVQIESGGKVTWQSVDGFNHDPASRLDAGGPRCFKANDPPRNSNLGAGQTYSVRLRYTPSTDLVEISEDDGATWSSCNSIVIDRAQSTAEVAVIPYRCDIHTGMHGQIQIHA